MTTIDFIIVAIIGFVIGIVIGNLLFYFIDKHKEEKQNIVDNDDIVFFYKTEDRTKIINIEKLISIQKFELPPDITHEETQYGIEYLLDNNTSIHEFFDTEYERDDLFDIAYKILNQLPID